MDVNTNAFRIVRALTEEKEETVDVRKESARTAGKIGGRARAGRLTPERRTEIARMGGASRRKSVKT